MTPVSSGQVITDNVGVFQWKFYTFAVPPQGTHSLSVHMKTIGNGVSNTFRTPFILWTASWSSIAFVHVL